MADDLNIDIDVQLKIDEQAALKQFASVAKKLGTTKAKLMKDLGIEIGVNVDVQDIQNIVDSLTRLDDKAKETGKNLREALKIPASKETLFSSILGELGLLESRIESVQKKTNKLAGTKTSGGSGLDVGDSLKTPGAKPVISRTPAIKTLKQAIIDQLFEQILADGITMVDTAGLNVEVGSFKSDMESVIKQKITEFDDNISEYYNEYVDAVDLMSEYTDEPIRRLQEMAKEIATSQGFKFKSSDEMLTSFNIIEENIADDFIAGIARLADGFSTDTIRNTIFKDQIEKAISNFEISSDGKTITINPAMFINAMLKAVEKDPAILVGANILPRGKGIALSPFEDFFTKQAPDSIRLYLQNQINTLKHVKQGDLKLAGKLEQIQERIFQLIFDNALAAAERSLRENNFNRRALDTYAPSADVSAIAGSQDTDNLMRYAEEAAAKAIHDEERRLGLAFGTFAKFADQTYSTRFNEFFAEIESNPNALFDPAKVLGAGKYTTFFGSTGDVSGSASGSRPLEGIPNIGQQILDNPAILERLLNVKPDAFQKKVLSYLAERADKIGLDDADLEIAQFASYVDSFIGQIKQMKAIQEKAASFDDYKSSAEADIPLSLKPRLVDKNARKADAALGAEKYQEQKDFNKKYGAERAREVAIYREALKQLEALKAKENKVREIPEYVRDAIKAGVPKDATKRQKSDYEKMVREQENQVIARSELRVARAAYAEAIKTLEAEKANGRPTKVFRDNRGAQAPVQAGTIPESLAAPAGSTPNVNARYSFEELVSILQREKNLRPDFAVAVDTEFNKDLNQKMTEFSAVIQLASGEFLNLLDIIQVPLDTKNLAFDKTESGAKSVKDLVDRATGIGIPLGSIGNTTDAQENAKAAYKNAQDLITLFDAIALVDVPITGSNLASAEVPAIKGFIEYVNSVALSIGGTPLPNPDVMRRVFDSVREYSKVPGQNEIIQKLPLTEGGTKRSTGLQQIMGMIDKEFPDFLKQFSSIIRKGKDGFLVSTPAGQEVSAHYAIADAVMSLIVKRFHLEYMPASIAARGAGVAKTSGAGGGGNGPTVPAAAAASEDPMGNRKADSLARTFHTQNKISQLVAGLTEQEKLSIENGLKTLRISGKQLELSAQILAKETAIAEKRAQTNKMIVGSTKQELTASRPDFIGPAPSKRSQDLKELRKEIEKLDAETIKLTRDGERNEEAVIAQVLAEGRHKQVREENTDNARKQHDLDIQRNQAGKAFAAQIKANVRAELDAQKALQRANKEQINQWVTARYALYDVGNFYTNVYQQMFRLTRQIFDTTKAYRSFETAFTSVERAMQLTGDATLDVRNQLISMSEEIPVTFEELSKIATLGAQMGIGAGGIQDFTETIAQFASVTGISADTVAQKFGRIAELAKVDSSQYANLGSAVAYAGVNAVATESEILNLSEAIAAVSTNAGFTPQEIIGMSTALASVGVQAEQARGVFTRVFADIDRAVSKGGSTLDAFAKVSGMSSEEFAKSWKTNGEASTAFRSLLAGLGSSSDITKSFDALNIVESREINTLTRLAESLGVWDRAMSDANASYEDGIFLGQSFNKTVDNLDSQLVIFKNNIDSFAAAFSVGFGNTLKDFLKTGSQILEFLKGGSSATLASFLLPAAAGLTAIGGASALAISGVTKLVAQLYAFRVAQIQSLNSGATEMTKFSDRIKQLSGAYSGLIEVRSNLGAFKGAEQQRGEVVPVTYTPYDQLKAQVQGVLKWDYLRTVELARQKELLKDQTNIYLVTSQGFGKAAVEDARRQADAVQRFVDGLKNRAASIASAMVPGNGDADKARRASLLQQLSLEKVFISVQGEQVTMLTKDAVEKAKNAAITKGATAAEKAYAASIVEVNAATKTATTTTVSWTSRIGNIIAGAVGWGTAIFGIISVIDMLITAMNNANDIKFLEQGGGVESLRDAIAKDTEEWKKNGEAISTTEVEYTDYQATASKARTEIVNITGVTGSLATATDTTTESVKKQTLAIGQNTKEWMLNAIVGNEKVNQWLEDNPTLFNDAESALQEYGSSFSEVMQSILADPKNGQEQALNKLNGALGRNKQALIAHAKELVKLNPSGTYGDMLKDPVYRSLLRRETAIKKLITLIPQMGTAFDQALNKSSFLSSMKEALGITEDLGDGISNTTAKVKTLTQWAGEVGQVMQSAFDIRYGKNTALDNIRKAWSDLKKKADDAKKAIKKAQDQINSLKADRGVLEYQLSVALRYGDSKRAAEIQAKLNENTTSTSEAQDQLTEAQKNASTELRDGSDAAIQNRAALAGLAQTYIPYIQALLNSGKSQKDVAKEVDKLKKEFESQAKALGFADADIQGYVGTFDTYKKVVKEMPKDVTIKINGLDAATRAMREFAAAVATATSNGSELPKLAKDLQAAYSVVPTGGTIGKRAIAAQILGKEATIAAYSQFVNDPSFTAAQRIKYSDGIQRLTTEILALQRSYANFATGGYVSGPGTGTSDSINAKLSNGEFVMSANAVSGYGVGFMNALNQNRVMFAPAAQAAQNNQASSQLVYLSPEDRSLLRAAIDRPVNLYANGTQLARSVNNGNKVLAQRGTV